MKITVAELIVRFMERLGITHVFGMPGAHILPVYDRLRDSGIATVLVKHEQGAAFMAGGHVRASGRLAACVTTAGPGATNLVTGLANAYADRLPMLVVTGETSTWIFGKGGLQESSGEGGAFDQAALFGAITRYHRLVERTDYLGQVLRQAARILREPASGPVLLSFPYNVQKETVDADILDTIDFSPPHPVMRSCAAQGDALAALIAAARRPVIIAGHGCARSGAEAVLARLSETCALPVATSLKGKGVFDEAGELSLGCLGITSDGLAYRYIAEQADLVIFLGAAFNERTSSLWDGKLLAGKKVAQIDIDPAQLEKVFRADLAVAGDIAPVLADTLAALERRGMPPKAYSRPERAEMPAHFRLVEHFFDRLAARHADAQVFDDNIILAQSHFKASPRRRYFPNSGISALGHALPAAIGARLATGRPTFAILGDGGFQMCGMELMTAVNRGIPLNVLMINNGTLGLIRKNQFQLYGGRTIDCDFVNPDYELLARAFGIGHARIETAADIDRLFERPDLDRSINLIELPWDKNVFPGYIAER